MRRIRRTIEILIPVLGMLIVLGALLFILELRTQIIVTIVGLLLIEVGVWDLARPLLPNERQYHALRTEVDGFIALVRRLNAAALEADDVDSPEARRSLEDVRTEMTRAVDRMAMVAGRTDAEIRLDRARVEAGIERPVSSAGRPDPDAEPGPPQRRDDG